MVNLSRIDKNVYKSLGFKNKSIGQTMIKEVLQTKVTNYKTVPSLLQHIKPRISNLVNLGLDINDKKMYKQLKSIKKISKKIDKELEEGNKNAEKIFVKWEQEFNNKIRYVTGKIKVKEIYYARELTSSDFGVATGLISQGYWEQSKWYFVNVERGNIADKLQPRNINVSFNNNSNVPIDVIIFTFYNDQLEIDVETGIVTK